MNTINDVIRVLVNASRGQLNDSVIDQCHAVIDQADAAPAAAAPQGTASA
jgi:hypothetical protein